MPLAVQINRFIRVGLPATPGTLHPGVTITAMFHGVWVASVRRDHKLFQAWSSKSEIAAVEALEKQAPLCEAADVTAYDYDKVCVCCGHNHGAAVYYEKIDRNTAPKMAEEETEWR